MADIIIILLTFNFCNVYQTVEFKLRNHYNVKIGDVG